MKEKTLNADSQSLGKDIETDLEGIDFSNFEHKPARPIVFSDDEGGGFLDSKPKSTKPPLDEVFPFFKDEKEKSSKSEGISKKQSEKGDKDMSEEAKDFVKVPERKESKTEPVAQRLTSEGEKKKSTQEKCLMMTGGIRGGHPVSNDEEFLFTREGVGVGYTFFKYDENDGRFVRWVSNDLDFARRESICGIYEEVPIYWKDGRYLRRANPEEEKLYWGIRNKL